MAELIELDLTAHVPIYSQIVEQLRARIAAGELEAGEQLPTVRRLAEELAVNFNTVARAYRLLDAEGWISTQHGRGTFVLGDGESRREAGGRGGAPGARGSERAARPASEAAGSGGDARPTLRRLARNFAAEAERHGFSPEQVAREVGYVLEEWAQEQE